jgi:hypothetical protein
VRMMMMMMRPVRAVAAHAMQLSAAEYNLLKTRTGPPYNH